MLTSIRQGLAVLLDGMLGLMVVMFASTALMVAVLFSAIITERRRELGLLKAIGARRSQIVGMLLCEAALATAVGGLIGCVLGVLLLRIFEHSLVYYLDSVGVPFAWLDTDEHPDGRRLACIAAAAAIGAAGAFYPAWRASRARDLRPHPFRGMTDADLRQCRQDLCDRARPRRSPSAVSTSRCGVASSWRSSADPAPGSHR